MPLNPYLNFKGNAEEGLTHYRGVLRGEIDLISHHARPRVRSRYSMRRTKWSLG